MQLAKFELHNLLEVEETISGHQFFELVQTVERQVFAEGLYKNGPTVIETKLSVFGKPERHPYKVYIPLNKKVDHLGTWRKSFKVEKVAKLRAAFDEELGLAFERVKQFMEDNEVSLAEDRLILVMMEVYGDYWVDILLPFKEERN